MNRATQVVTRTYPSVSSKRCKRSGSLAMMARRSADVMSAQRAISSVLRPQPTHSFVLSLRRQILTQGVSKALPLLVLGLCKEFGQAEQSG
jgi:hypothetical protein